MQGRQAIIKNLRNGYYNGAKKGAKMESELKDLVLQALDDVEKEAQIGGGQKASENLQKKDSMQATQTNENEISLNARLNENLNALKDNLNSESSAFEAIDNTANTANATKSLLSQNSLNKDSLRLTIQSSKTTSGKVIPAQEAVFSPSNIEFLEMLREKLLVLFEGLKMPQMRDSKEKLDLVVNFLQYELCLLDDFLKDNKK